MIKACASCAPLLLSLALGACNGGWDTGGNSTNGTTPIDWILDSDYIGPGSVWELKLYTNTQFELSRRQSRKSTSGKLFEGKYQTSNGFTELNIDDGSSVPALLVEGVAAFMLSPEGDDQLVVMVPADQCSSILSEGIWLRFGFPDNFNSRTTSADSFADTAYGRLRYALTSDSSTGEESTDGEGANAEVSIEFGYNFYADNYSGGNNDEYNANNCTKGIADGGNDQFYLNQDSIIVSLDENDDANTTYLLGLKQVSIKSIGFLDVDYIGFVDDTLSGPGLINATCESGGLCNIYSASSIDTAKEQTSLLYSMAIDRGDEPQKGFISGTLTDLESNTGNVVCISDTASDSDNKQFLSCVAQFPSTEADASPEAVNFFLYESNI